MNASAISAAEPVAAAGSGMPQCAVIGWPGQTGQVSPAALSQTVNTKSSAGAPGLANSLQDFERKPGRIVAEALQQPIACGLTCPFGWLPAL